MLKLPAEEHLIQLRGGAVQNGQFGYKMTPRKS
jgi:hypothetical protein